MRNWPVALGCMILTAHVALAAEPAVNPIESDGTVNVPAFRLPPSVYVSDEAKQALPRKPLDMGAALDRIAQGGNAQRIRMAYANSMARQVDALRKQFNVTTEEVTIAGIHGFRARPVGGVPRANPNKILIHLPGGGFVMATAAAGLTESIPLAGLGKFEIVSLDYRQAPEATFPAASEDVTAVYRELLKTHPPRDIGIFGCSAGGLLTAQALAWFEREHLPMPGAAGIFCASADARWAGDSWYWFKPLQGLTTAPTLDERFYYGDHDLADPLMSPIESMAVLKQFPPTLLITATRAGELSAAVNTHRLLVKAGVDAELHVWDGLNHAFYIDSKLPESREAFDVMVRFFNRHLGNTH